MPLAVVKAKTSKMSSSNQMQEIIEGFWDDNFQNYLTEAHGVEIKLLLKTFEDFRKTGIDLESLMFESQAVLDRTWEKLNIGKWTDVPEERKQVFAIASYIRVIALLRQNAPDAVHKSLEVTDLGILLGLPFRSLSLTKIADILSSSIQEQPTVTHKRPNTQTHTRKKCKLINEIDTVSCPSLEFFRINYFSKNRPVKLTKCIDHWPALTLWQNLDYIVGKAGHRTVPIELGKHYADGSYSQKLMKVSDFVGQYFRDDADTIGYLAQHQLFDQVPELKKDLTEPDYCAISDKPDPHADIEINAWFGPKGTVSPLHFDPKHNLLCQVVGSKKIILYSAADSQYLYPHDSSLLFNTSRVDVENPDLDAFPEFVKARREECLLNAGEMLYIPPKYWHHVRSLENSFSVSFWWE